MKYPSVCSLSETIDKLFWSMEYVFGIFGQFSGELKNWQLIPNRGLYYGQFMFMCVETLISNTYLHHIFFYCTFVVLSFMFAQYI